MAISAVLPALGACDCKHCGKRIYIAEDAGADWLADDIRKINEDKTVNREAFRLIVLDRDAPLGEVIDEVSKMDPKGSVATCSDIDGTLVDHGELEDHKMAIWPINPHIVSDMDRLSQLSEVFIVTARPEVWPGVSSLKNHTFEQLTALKFPVLLDRIYMGRGFAQPGLINPASKVDAIIDVLEKNLKVRNVVFMEDRPDELEHAVSALGKWLKDGRIDKGLFVLRR